MLKQLIFAGIGGGAGSILRFAVSKLVQPKDFASFPWATFSVNVAGCLIIGCLIGLSAKCNWLDDYMKALLISGFCGGFTTFSAFSLESYRMFQSGAWLMLAAYILLSVIVGFIAVYAGLIIIKGI
jgi:CrcB protein